MPLQPPVIPDWRAGTIPHATGPAGQTDFNTGIRDALAFLTARLVFRAHQTVSQSIPNTTWTAINWALAGIDEDPYTGWSNTNPSRWTAPIPGSYLVYGTAWFAGTTVANTTGSAGIGFDQGGTGGFVTTSCEQCAPADNNPWGIPAGWSTYLGVSDYVTLATFQSSGGALSTSVAVGQQSQIDVYWLSS